MVNARERSKFRLTTKSCFWNRHWNQIGQIAFRALVPLGGTLMIEKEVILAPGNAQFATTRVREPVNPALSDQTAIPLEQSKAQEEKGLFDPMEYWGRE